MKFARCNQPAYAVQSTLGGPLEFRHSQLIKQSRASTLRNPKTFAKAH